MIDSLKYPTVKIWDNILFAAFLEGKKKKRNKCPVLPTDTDFAIS